MPQIACSAGQSGIFVDQTAFKLRCSATKQAQLGIWPEPPVLDPPAKKIVFTRNPIAFQSLRWPTCLWSFCGDAGSWHPTVRNLQSAGNFIAQPVTQFFIRIQRQNPFSAGLLDS